MRFAIIFTKYVAVIVVVLLLSGCATPLGHSYKPKRFSVKAKHDVPLTAIVEVDTMSFYRPFTFYANTQRTISDESSYNPTTKVYFHEKRTVTDPTIPVLDERNLGSSTTLWRLMKSNAENSLAIDNEDKTSSDDQRILVIQMYSRKLDPVISPSNEGGPYGLLSGLLFLPRFATLGLINLTGYPLESTKYTVNLRAYIKDQAGTVYRRFDQSGSEVIWKANFWGAKGSTDSMISASKYIMDADAIGLARASNKALKKIMGEIRVDK